MTTRRLLEWDALQRRRASPAGWLGHPWLLWALLATATAGALEMIARTAGTSEARAWWLALVLVTSGAVVLGAPWRFFWRRDVPLLARLPITGDVFFDLGTIRGARTAGGLALVLVAGAAPRLIVGDVILALAALAAAALLAPVVAVAAGVMVASPRAQKLVDDMTGAGGAPSVVWLSFLPAMGAAGLGFGIYALRGLVGQALLVAGAAVLWGAARTAARGTLAIATREVAALDQVKLAHVERATARGLEAMWGRAIAGAGRVIYRKDVALGRRRYPAYYLVVGAAVLTMWGLAAFASPEVRARWTMGLAAAIAAYTILFARRLTMPPVEHPRLLKELPVAPAAARRAKVVHVAWRAFAPILAGALPGAVRAQSGWLLVAALAAAGAATALGWLVLRQTDDLVEL